MLKLKFKLKTALSISGYTSSLFFDKATARNEEGIPIIPATAIKGALRIEYERIFPNDSDTDLIFGNENRESILRFENGDLSGESVEFFKKSKLMCSIGYTSRIGVAISRKLRTSKEEYLFNFETTAPFLGNLLFEAQVKNEEHFDSSIKDKFLRYLNILKKIGIFIGGDKSRGCGYFEFDFEEVLSPPKDKNRQITKLSTYIIRLIPEEEFRVSFLKPREFLYESINYIPGSTLRGALAKKWIEEYGKDDIFSDTFLKNPIHLTHFYPSIGKVISKPIPLSARCCKAFPGLGIRAPSSSWKTEASHGIRDMLIESFIFKKLKENGVNVFLSDFERCNYCNNPLDAIEGFYVWISESPQKIPVQSHFETKLKLDRKLMAAEEGNLYSYEVWDKKIKAQRGFTEYSFVGLMDGKDTEVIQKISDITEIFVGGGRSRGFGKMKIEVSSYPEEGIKEKLEEFNQKLKNRIEDIRGNLNIAGEDLFGFDKKTYFSITLFSDIILPFNKSLHELLKDKIDQNLNIEAGFLRSGIAGGYNFALNIRKELRTTISKGSVLLLSTEMKRDGLIGKLKDIEKEGLGLRIYEGFGKVFFGDKFHLLFGQK
ncbi:MAG: RAMP superfamily CRISPR-associated protein [Acidobacteriota bacterium]